MIEEGATALTGRIPINSSGGLLAMGHPFGPTGLGQIAEIFWQLRGEAGARQIPNAKPTGLAHMIGLGGTCIVHIFNVSLTGSNNTGSRSSGSGTTCYRR